MRGDDNEPIAMALAAFIFRPHQRSDLADVERERVNQEQLG